MFHTQEGVWKANAGCVDVKSSVGAGDAMVAGIALALEEGVSLLERIQQSVACSVE